jgi:hypothetical protein
MDSKLSGNRTTKHELTSLASLHELSHFPLSFDRGCFVFFLIGFGDCHCLPTILAVSSTCDCVDAFQRCVIRPVPRLPHTNNHRVVVGPVLSRRPLNWVHTSRVSELFIPKTGSSRQAHSKLFVSIGGVGSSFIKLYAHLSLCHRRERVDSEGEEYHSHHGRVLSSRADLPHFTFSRRNFATQVCPRCCDPTAAAK